MEPRLVLSKSVSFAITPGSELAIHASISRAPYFMRVATVHVLEAFATPRTVAEAYERARTETSTDPESFREAVAALRRQGVLVEVGHDDVPRGALATSGFGSVAEHHKMLRDQPRVWSYRSAIAAAVAGKRVLDLGCGSGVLSLFAATHGAAKVYAIEETEVSLLAEQNFARNEALYRARGCKGIELHTGNSLDIELPERVDVIIHELIGDDPFGENMLRFLDDARTRFLKPGGRMLPAGLEVYCIGVESEYVPSVAQRALREAAEYRHGYGVDLSAVVETVERSLAEPRLQAVYWNTFDNPREALFGQAVLTDESLLARVDFSARWSLPPEAERRVTLRVNQPGRLCGALVFFRVNFGDGLWLSTSPFSMRTSWGWVFHELPRATAVRPGDEVHLRWDLEPIEGVERILLSLA